jgi:dTDP-4-dehydrorhamnose 3,5-epimerase
MNSTIQDVVFKELKTNHDERGFFREIIRTSDEFFKGAFGQWSHSLMFQDVVKAWHLHRIQTDWWYVTSGVLKVVLHDTRQNSVTHRKTVELLMGSHQTPGVLRIPPGVAHGCKVIQGPADLLYVTSHVYNPEDEIRISYNDSTIDYDWLKGAPIT